MHTQAEHGVGSIRGSAGNEAERRLLERRVLAFLAEQVAIPEDQLARFVRASSRAVGDVVAGLQERDLVEWERFLVGDRRWVWLSRAGARLAGGGVRYRRPNVPSLDHRRAINEVRLFLRRRAPAGIWVPERVIQASRTPGGHLPDGILELDLERHAIEVELSHKARREIVEILAEHSRRYDAVVYFCGPGALPLMRRVGDERRWPKLVVRSLPRGKRC